jgi:hypothetical protein
MSSSKLQPYLELCRFVQTLLKTKVARWKAHFLIGIGKRPRWIIHQNGWHMTRGTQLKRRVLRLESRCCNESHPDPKIMASLRLMIESLFCVPSNPCLTFLSSACISSIPNNVCSLFHAYHRDTSWWFHKHLPFALPELVYHWFQACALHGSVHFQAMKFWSRTWLHVSVLIYCLREYHLRSRRWSIPFGSSYPDGGCHP